MNNPFEAVVIPGSILLLGFFSALLLPAPVFGLQLAKYLMGLFHFSDLDQLYTIVFGLWFLLMGTIEFFVIRLVWRRFFSV